MAGTDTKHTPGPWRVATSAAYDDQMGEIGHTVCVVIGDKIIHITHAGVAGMPDDYLEQRANARLIAAAPEMYEALEALVGEIEWEIGEEKWGRDPDALAKAKRVLAKVRGGDGDASRGMLGIQAG